MQMKESCISGTSYIFALQRMKMSRRLPKVPVILQTKRNECGLKALQMLFLYYGDIFLDNETQSRKNLQDEYTAKELIEIARKHGYLAGCLKMKPKELLKVEFPCIAFFRGNHFVVYLGVKKGHIYIIDPAYGKRRLSVEDFSKRYREIVIIAKPLNKDSVKTKFLSIYKCVFPVFLMLSNALITLVLVILLKVRELYVYVLVLPLIETEKLYLTRKNIASKIKYYKNDLIGHPILFFAYKDNGLDTKILLDEYTQFIINISYAVSIFEIEISCGHFANGCQVLILMFLQMFVKRTNYKYRFVLIALSLLIIVSINVLCVRGIHLVYSVLTIYLFYVVYEYRFRTERRKAMIDEENINR